MIRRHLQLPLSHAVGPTGRPLQRSNPVNPTYRPSQRRSQPVAPTASVQHFHPLNQPLPVRLVDAAASGSVLGFPAGSLDWLKGFLQRIMSPEDYLKHKSSFEPTPQREEVPLALQLANKTKERGSVLTQIERERVLISDLRAKYEKHTETLTQLMERKYSLQKEIEESLRRSRLLLRQSSKVSRWNLWPQVHRKALSQLGLGNFPGPPPLVEEVPQDEEGDDEAMESGALTLAGAGVVLSNRPNVSLPRHLLSSECWERCFLKRTQVVFDCEGCVVEYARPSSSSRTGD